MDRLARPVVQGDYHRRLTGSCPGWVARALRLALAFWHEYPPFSVVLKDTKNGPTLCNENNDVPKISDFCYEIGTTGRLTNVLASRRTMCQDVSV
jgi:hypothetical protein